MHATLVIAGLAFCTQVLHAALIIDAFDSPDGGQSVTLVNQPAGASDSNTRTADVLGGTRTLALEIQEEIVLFGTTKIEISPTLLRLSLKAGSPYDVQAILTYDGDGEGMHTDMSAWAGLSLTSVLQDSTPVQYTISITTDGKGASAASTTKPGLFNGDVSFPQSGFYGVTGSGVDWSHVDRLTIIVDPLGRGCDVRIKAVSLVPEHRGSAVALGLCGLAIFLKRNAAGDALALRLTGEKEGNTRDTLM
jgi:hypothetical protein